MIDDFKSTSPKLPSSYRRGQLNIKSREALQMTYPIVYSGSNGDGEIIREPAKMSFTTTLNRTIHRVPVAASGLMLGVAGEGLLLSSYGIVKNIFGTIAFLILALLLLKMAFNGKDVIADLQDPSAAGGAFTFPMAIILLSVYVRTFQPSIAYCMFWIAIIIHCVFIVTFTRKFVVHFTLENIFPSTFIVYVGIAIISVVAPVFNVAWVGRIFFDISFIAYLILLPLVVYRALTVKSVLEHPTNTIIGAPASLCLVGYFHSFRAYNMLIIWILTILSVIFLIYVLICMPRMMELKFNPAYSAFTFPFVICANASGSVNGLLIKLHLGAQIINYIVYFEELLAFCFVTYVLARYIIYFVNNGQMLSGNKLTAFKA
jgi:exfoliative toxin A/B